MSADEVVWTGVMLTWIFLYLTARSSRRRRDRQRSQSRRDNLASIERQHRREGDRP